MRSSLVIVAIGIALMAGPVIAGQAPAAPKPAPAAAPAAQTPPAPRAARRRTPPRPFPEGAKIAYVNVQRIAHGVGRRPGRDAKGQALREEKEKELVDAQHEARGRPARSSRPSALGAERIGPRRRSRRKSSGCRSICSASSRTRRRRSRSCSSELQVEFQRKLLPVLSRKSAAKGLHMVFSSSTRAWSGPTRASTSRPTSIKKLDAAAAAGAQEVGASAAAAGRLRGRPLRSPPAAAPAAASGHAVRRPLARPTCPRITSCSRSTGCPTATRCPWWTPSSRTTRGRALEAVKNVTVSEEFFQGHFPASR